MTRSKGAKEPKQKQFKDGKLESGITESNGNNHPVTLTRTNRVSSYTHLSKSINVSSLKKDVTIDKITGHISGNVFTQPW